MKRPKTRKGPKRTRRSSSRKPMKIPIWHATFSNEGVRMAHLVKGVIMVAVVGRFRLGAGAKEIRLPKKLGALFVQPGGAMLLVENTPSPHGMELFRLWLEEHAPGLGRKDEWPR